MHMERGSEGVLYLTPPSFLRPLSASSPCPALFGQLTPASAEWIEWEAEGGRCPHGPVGAVSERRRGCTGLISLDS